MKKTDNGRFPFYTFDTLAGFPDLCHFVSSGERREKSNIGFVEEAVAEQVCANRCAMAEAVGFDIHRLTVGAQVHSSNIAVVDESLAGRGALSNDNRLSATDALITACPDICIMVMAADCVPILLYDPVAGVIAAIHSGWRGTADGVVLKTVGLMTERFGCRAAHIVAGIGPSIGQCCFEVGEEVAEVFVNNGVSEGCVAPSVVSPRKYMIDLWKVNRQQLVGAGVSSENIEVAGVCTQCHPLDFFSYRHDAGHTGRFGAGVMMRNI